MFLLLAACCIGFACRLLQPKQPESAFATLLLILAMFFIVTGLPDIYELVIRTGW